MKFSDGVYPDAAFDHGQLLPPTAGSQGENSADEGTPSDPRLVRAVYIDRYGKDAWTRALETATRHRSRAAKDWGLTEHFTACEWLDLCAETDFGCARCGEKVTLTPHHRVQLAIWGKNTIDNIEPLCQNCHDIIPVFGGMREVGEVWLADQQAVFERWTVGDLVSSLPYGSGVAFRLGVVVSVTPPELGPGRLYGRAFSAENYRARQRFGACQLTPDEVIAASGVQPPVQAHHVETLVHVRLPGGETLYPVDPRALTAVEPAAAKAEALKWIAAQERLVSKFRAGDAVHKRAGFWSNGVVMEIAPYTTAHFTGFIGEDQPPITPTTWVPGSEVQARVLWRYTRRAAFRRPHRRIPLPCAVLWAVNPGRRRRGAEFADLRASAGRRRPTTRQSARAGPYRPNLTPFMARHVRK